jgi:hypothetical protein
MMHVRCIILFLFVRGEYFEVALTLVFRGNVFSAKRTSLPKTENFIDYHIFGKIV